MSQAEKLYEDANELMSNDDFLNARNVSKKKNTSFSKEKNFSI
jgi:hypothetical protein